MTKSILIALLIGMTLAAGSIHAADNSGKIVVMPVESPDNSLSEGVATLQEIIGDYFENNHAVRLISEEQREAMTGEITTGSRAEIVRAVTEKMAGDRALVFTLNRYRERVGDEYSVEDPASLAFEFKLVNVETGATICSGRYDETQQSLTENILDLPRAYKRGFKWITVKKMAVEAVREKLAACPALQSAPAE